MAKDKDVSISDVFREQERKLNAASAAQLDTLRSLVTTDPYYATSNDPRFVIPLLAGFPLRVPQEDTGLRMRHYFDNSALTATRSNVEIRLEDRGYTGTGGWPYKQVVKIGAAGTERNHTLNRMEHTAKLKTPRPQLQVVQGDGADYLKDIFNARGLTNLRLYPLVAIASQRWKLRYHPDGNPNVQIELSTDIGRGQAITGFSWDLFQVEFEMKKGDPKWLEPEERRFREHLPFLIPETRSKPSPGFDRLAVVLAEKKSRDTLRHALKDGAFRIITL